MEELTDKNSALAVLERASTAIAKTITTYLVPRRVNNVRALDRRDETLLDRVEV